MHLESDQGTTSDYALQVLTPAARETVLRAMDELGAALEDRTLTATLETDIAAIVLEQFEDIIEAARVMNLPPLPPKNRIAIETNPVLKLRLAKLQTPIPLDVIKSIQDNELAHSRYGVMPFRCSTQVKKPPVYLASHQLTGK